MSANLFLSNGERAILENAKIGIAGAGGLGSNVASLLVRAGVRRLTIADFDVVAPSNLNRQFYFRDQVGRKKVEALAENLRRIDPGVELSLHDVRLDAGNLSAVFADCRIVVEAFDNVASKTALLAAFADRTVVAASGIAGWGRSTDLSVRRVGKNLVLVGDFASEAGPETPPQSARVAIAAAMQANAVLATLLGIGRI